MGVNSVSGDICGCWSKMWCVCGGGREVRMWEKNGSFKTLPHLAESHASTTHSLGDTQRQQTFPFWPPSVYFLWTSLESFPPPPDTHTHNSHWSKTEKKAADRGAKPVSHWCRSKAYVTRMCFVFGCNAPVLFQAFSRFAACSASISETNWIKLPPINISCLKATVGNFDRNNCHICWHWHHIPTVVAYMRQIICETSASS